MGLGADIADFAEDNGISDFQEACDMFCDAGPDFSDCDDRADAVSSRPPRRARSRSRRRAPAIVPTRRNQEPGRGSMLSDAQTERRMETVAMLFHVLKAQRKLFPEYEAACNILELDLLEPLRGMQPQHLASRVAQTIAASGIDSNEKNVRMVKAVLGTRHVFDELATVAARRGVTTSELLDNEPAYKMWKDMCHMTGGQADFDSVMSRLPSRLRV
uniref:Uncharacterized protein n=1 Tax=Alexandrium andersonii TaxID=327968 RepID=A0A7S2F6A5_9DINO